MPTLQRVPWEADPHTLVKHQLYKHYLAKWMPIMVKGWDANITYAEGFAGPGVYLDGSPGSPVIALGTARFVSESEHIRNKIASGRLRMVFVDKDQETIEMLQRELGKAASPSTVEQLRQFGVDVTVERGTCEPVFTDALTRVNAWGRPILAVLDTWGSGVSFDLVRRIAENINSEVIITLKPQFFIRWAATDHEHGDRVFGGTDWRTVAEQSSADKEAWVRRRYRDTLKAAGFTYVLDFELVDRRGESLLLLFGSTHPLGHKKMKEAMWEVDPVAGVGYRDPRDPGQETLEIDLGPQTAPLRRLILDHLASLPTRSATHQQLRDFALHRTVYKESQASQAVRELLEEGDLDRADHVSGSSGLTFTHTVQLPART